MFPLKCCYEVLQEYNLLLAFENQQQTQNSSYTCMHGLIFLNPNESFRCDYLVPNSYVCRNHEREVQKPSRTSKFLRGTEYSFLYELTRLHWFIEILRRRRIFFRSINVVVDL